MSPRCLVVASSLGLLSWAGIFALAFGADWLLAMGCAALIFVSVFLAVLAGHASYRVIDRLAEGCPCALCQADDLGNVVVLDHYRDETVVLIGGDAA